MNEMICVWEFRSVDEKQVVTSIHPAYPDDYKFEHEYQRIIFRGYRHDYERKA